jgi:hypothetical protein
LTVAPIVVSHDRGTLLLLSLFVIFVWLQECGR